MESNHSETGQKEQIPLDSVLVTKFDPSNVANIEQIHPIVEAHMVDPNTGIADPEEIEEDMNTLKGGMDRFGRTKKYFVAKDEKGKVLGVMGYTTPEPKMLQHFSTTPDESAEMVNAMVSEESRGKGVGKALLNAICDEVKSQGKKQLIWKSGERYQEGWNFHDKVGVRGTPIKNYFTQTGKDAQTWMKPLN